MLEVGDAKTLCTTSYYDSVCRGMAVGAFKVELQSLQFAAAAAELSSVTDRHTA